uniref:Protein TIC 214 n=1 Tax=Sphaeropteris brunoniana TaxID=204593 RepID=A0A7L8XKL2_9MONI|nr:Ycf1 [Sphaeropteris brunoniana]QOH97822.1 Ycf1 [Sphaeropteris brunoniana]
MTLNILNTLSLAWVKIAGPYVLFGIYYGLLTTLPVGPSQILCIRAFIMGGSLSGIVALSGSMVGQLLIILSVFCSPIYILLSKPHVLTIVVIPYMFLFWLRTKDLPDYQSLRPITSLRDSQIGNLFLNSFLFQIMNPILLPSPVLARLIHLFLFRYSNNVIFLISSFFGWLIGHILFSYLSRLLVVRVEKDSPLLYLLVKRAIYRTFSIILLINVIFCLGRAPVSFWTRKFLDESNDKDLDFWIFEYKELELLWWIFKPWPISFSEPWRTNRPIRFKKNNRFDINSLVKRRVSTYFFDKCVIDGKQRLSFAALPSQSICERQLEESSNNSDLSVGTYPTYRDWILKRLVRNEAFEKELKDRVKLLDDGSTFWKAMEKKTRLTSENKTRLPNVYDPFLTNSYRIRIPTPQTFLTVDELDLPTRKGSESVTNTRSATTRRNSYIGINSYKKRIEDWVSAKNKKSRHSNRTPLPWETLPRKAQRIFHFMFNNRLSFDFEIEDILNGINSSSSFDVTWEQIFDIDPIDRAMFLIYLEEDWRNFKEISLSDILSINGERRLSDPKNEARSIYKIEDLEKDLAHETEILIDNRFDVPGVESDVRYRKLRNLGISIAKTKRKTIRLVKRFAKISDFRRKVVKGSMRSRRRKILVWKMLQEKAHSPFFLRLMEIPTFFQLPIEGFTGLNSEIIITRPGEAAGLQLEQERKLSSATKGLSGSKSARSAVAARLDVGPIHSGRGLLLVLQPNFRKYIKLPISIAFKHFGRRLLLQDSEWDKDWREWRKEIHIKCTYDGEEFSHSRFPGRWLKEGLQIKILYPFKLKPWHTNGGKKRSTIREKLRKIKSTRGRGSKKGSRLERKRSQFTYLTAWGFQTDIPFGTIKKDPSFWKPVQRELIRIWKKNLSLRTQQVWRLYLRFNVDKILRPSLLRELSLFFGIKKISNDSGCNDITRKETLAIKHKNKLVESKSNIGKKSERSIHIDKKLNSIINADEGLVTDNNAHGFVDLSTDKIVRNEQGTKKLQVNELVMDDRLRGANLTVPMRFEKEIMGFGGIILKLRILIAEVNEKSFLVASAFFQRINRALAHYSNELAALQAQLRKVRSNTIGVYAETENLTLSVSGTKNRLWRVNKFQSLSQAHLYDNMWSMSIKGNLDLSFMLNETVKSSNSGERTRYTGDWDNSSTLYRTGKDWGSAEDCYDVTGNNDCSINKMKLLGINESNSDINNLLDCLDETGNKIVHKVINERIRESVGGWGFLKQLCELDANNWNRWVDCFYRCNLPLEVWRNIAPHKWRVGLENSNILKNIEINWLNEQEQDALRDNYSIYTKNPLLRDRIHNFNKRRKYSYSLQSFVDFVRDADTQEFPMRQDALAQKNHSKNRIENFTRVGGKKKLSYSHISDSEIKFKSKFDLMLWIVPDLAGIKSTSRKKPRLKNTVLRDESPNYRIVKLLDVGDRFQDTLNEIYEITLDERESPDYIFRWKWKSKALEGELEKLRNLTVLISILGNDQDLTAFCVNIGIDSDLLNLFLNTTRLSVLNNLCIVSAHRLPLVFDDQILMYKIVTPLLKFKYRFINRFKKRLYKDISNGCISRLSLIAIEGKTKQSELYNIEDLVLPRRRRELRFLRSLLTIEYPEPEEQYLAPIPEIGRFHGNTESNYFGLSEVQKIKRFLWPSHRLEELACVGRFCFNITNGSRFAMLKIRMYPIVKI